MAQKTQKIKGQELIYGIHPVVELIKAKRRALMAVYTTRPTPNMWEEIKTILPASVPIQYVSRDILTRMVQTADHQGVVAWVREFPFRTKPFDAQKQPFIVMLDGIQDPRNMGAIIRSAYCTGANGIILTKKSSAPLTAAALKASAGLAEHMEIYQAPSAKAAIQELKAGGYHIYLATLGGKDALSVTYQRPSCMVIGNEATGIASELFSFGIQVTLPQRRPDISYNASVAAGILLFLASQTLRQAQDERPEQSTPAR